MRSRTVFGLVTLAAALAMSAGSAVASAAVGTSAAAKLEHELVSIACVSAKSCVAVGKNAAASHRRIATLEDVSASSGLARWPVDGYLY